LACCPLPGGTRRTRDRRPQPSPHRTASCQRTIAGRQDVQHLRLQRRAHGQQGAAHGARRRRWLLDQGANILLFGPPGGAKSHLAAALGLALVQNGRRVLFMRTTDLVQRLQVARRELGLEAAITKLDKYQLLILDDIAYVTKDQAETSVLFELIAARYERRSLLIAANQPFGEWGKIFADQAMTLATIDRLVHHATILEMNVESYRRRAALQTHAR
jgi:DNA replication protein DnaC